MALLIMEGFEDFGDTDDMDRNEYLVTVGTMAFETGRVTGQALTINSFDDDVYFHPETGSSATWYCGCALKFANAPSSASIFMYFNSTGTAGEIRLYLTTEGKIQVRRGSTLLGTSTGAIDTVNWNHMVVKVFMDNSAGTAELWLNGTKEIDVTGLDTITIGPPSIVAIQLASVSASLPMAVDDFYFGDDTGTDMTDQPGDCHIEMLTPNANGTTNNFTASPAVSNYLNVDDGDTPDDDATYNHSSTATHKELYACSNITSTVDTIHAVQVRAMVRKEDAGNRLINLICRNNTTEVDSGQKGVPINYAIKTKIYENDPDGGGNWTEADVNAMEIGLEIGT